MQVDNHVRSFWDCGFRTTSTTYNNTLQDIIDNNNITFVRVAAGTEFRFGDVRIIVLAPSLDLRNRFDTFGIGKNDASIVLKISYNRSHVILAADAEFASWGKVTEEFPRKQSIDFFEDAIGLAERNETADQLKCDLLKLSHHGSKHGTTLEYLERIEPNRVVITAGDRNWYLANQAPWVDLFPHNLVQQILSVLNSNLQIFTSGVDGNLIFKYSGNWGPRHRSAFQDVPGAQGFDTALLNEWQL